MRVLPAIVVWKIVLLILTRPALQDLAPDCLGKRGGLAEAADKTEVAGLIDGRTER